MKSLDLDQLAPAENQLLNERAVAIRQEFNELVDVAGGNAGVDWAVSSIASRNRYLSPLFLRCSRLALVRQLLAEGTGLREIRTADRALADVLRDYLQRERMSTAVVCTETAVARFRRWVRPFYNWASDGVLFLGRCLARSKQGRERLRGRRGLVFLDTFVLESKIGEEGSIHAGEYKDRYYPGLLASLGPEEKRDIFYLPAPVGYRNLFRAFSLIRSARAPFVIIDDFLTVSDYWYALSYPWRILRHRIENCTFLGFRVDGMLHQENIEKCANYCSLLALLNYRFAARLAKENIGVRLLIDWNENQVMDRALVAGFRRYHPDTLTVGYQGYIIAKPLNIYIHPTESEIRSGGIPHKMAVVGDALREEMKEFAAGLDVITGPAFRFQKVWRQRKYEPDVATFTVLVGLPIALKESAEILELMKAAKERLSHPNLRYWIKPHPTYGPDRIRELLPAWPREFECKTGDFNDCIERCNLLVGNGSSTCVEALAKGVPVIIVGNRNGISQNPIPDGVGKEMWTVCYAEEELAAAIMRFSELAEMKGGHFARLAESIRRDCFEPVTRESVRKFLGFDHSAPADDAPAGQGSPSVGPRQ